MGKYDSIDCFRDRIEGKWCVYCGEPADVGDHFPPRSVSRAGLILPACSECNNLAEDEWPFDFEARDRLVKTKLEERYGSILKRPDWDEDEIEELGSNLRAGVIVCRNEKDRLRKRLAWNAVEYLSYIDHSNAFAQFGAKIDITIKSEKGSSKNTKIGRFCSSCGAKIDHRKSKCRRCR